jgi:4-hydroxybenzoate polyprenyltransferase
MTLVQRLWIYQRERFPLLSHSLLVAALTVGASGFASAGASWPPLTRMVGAFAVAVGFFLLLRLADEFKDAADDAAYRPYRPVPRGLVTLRELGGVGFLVLILQLAITLLLGWELLPYLLAAWVVLLLMSREFFVAEWLRARPMLYMLSHMLILPLIDLNLLAAAGQRVGEPTAAWGWFLVTTYTNGIVFEVGRKIRASEDEEVGVETYSALWGVPRATAVWLLAVGIAGASGIAAGWSVSQEVGIRSAMALGFVCGWIAAAWVGWQMVLQPSSNNSRWIELSGLWVLAFYLSLGLLPHWG